MRYQHGCYQVSLRHYGFSLFEFVIVLALVAVLFSAVAARYESKISQAQSAMISFQAKAFVRSIENIRAMSTIANSNEVHIGDGVVVYLNNYGWPFLSNVIPSNDKKEKSVSGCNSLWQSLFTNSLLDGGVDHSSVEKNIEISLINNHICRYKLVRKKEGSHFFDYDVKTGNVVVTSIHQ